MRSKVGDNITLKVDNGRISVLWRISGRSCWKVSKADGFAAKTGRFIVIELTMKKEKTDQWKDVVDDIDEFKITVTKKMVSNEIMLHEPNLQKNINVKK